MRIRSFLILTVTAFCSFFLSCTDSDRAIKVMSFNIRYDNPADGINSWQNRKALVSSFLNEQRPDIIGFQEVLKNQLNELQDELTEYSYIGVGRDDGKDGGEFVPIFYLKEKFDLLASSHFWLSETPDVTGSKSWGAALPRIVTWLQLKDKENGFIFYVFNTHFSHVSIYARNESSILLLNKIRTIVGDAPVVLTGDFNAPPSERMYNTITNNWKGYLQLWDSRQLTLDYQAASKQTFNGFKHDTPEVIIDHIFVNGFFDVNALTTHQIVKDDVFISDHYPITAELSFRLNKREKWGEAQTLMQSTQQPIIDCDQLCFHDSLVVKIRPRGRKANIYYTLNGEEPDTLSALYEAPILLKKSTTLKTMAYIDGMYPSKVLSQTFIKKRKSNARLLEVIPEADEKYHSKDYKALFDHKPGHHNNLSDGSWIGFNGTDNDFLFDFKRPTKVKELYVSCLAQPSKWIVSPSKVEVKTSNDGINYKVVGSMALHTSFKESINERFMVHIPFAAKARFVKVSVYNGGLLPKGHSGVGNPSWYFIDEMVLQ